MTDEAQHLQTLIDGAAGVPADQQSQFLQEACADPLMREKVVGLLRHIKLAEEDDTFLPGLPDEATGAGNQDARLVPLTHDFHVICELGRGASGVVYLANQISLSRKVALKVTGDTGKEAQNMAGLEHPNIVQVFFEQIDALCNVRQICMQYVPGPVLTRLIQAVDDVPAAERSGAKLVELIDALASGESVTGGLKERDQLVKCDYFESVCRMGMQLASALAYTHASGILHRDIKPENILAGRDGRLYLTDFGIASNVADGNRAESFGGTIPYMAPEHLDAINPDCRAGSEVVDERSDIYSLGMVLRELATLQPLTGSKQEQTLAQRCGQLARERREAPASLRHEFPEIPTTLDHVIRRCLDPSPEKRFDANGLATALEGCLARMAVEKQLPPAGFFARMVAKHPFAVSVATSHLPHLAGCLFCPVYNAVVLFENYTMSQRIAFVFLPLIYGCIMSPLQFLFSWFWFRSATTALGQVRRSEHLSETRMNSVRQRILAEPVISLVQSVFAWLPLILYVPAYLWLFIEPMTAREFAHLCFSVGISVLIVGTYSFLIIQYYVVRVWYPLLLIDAAILRTQAHKDLDRIPVRARLFHFLALLAPLLASLLLIVVGPGEFGENSYYVTFRVLVVITILAGVTGASLTHRLSNLICRCVDAIASQKSFVAG